MPKNMTEHLEHRSNTRVQDQEEARMDARIDAMEARREMMDSHLTEAYQGRNDLLIEKVYTLESNLLYHTLRSVSDHSN